MVGSGGGGGTMHGGGGGGADTVGVWTWAGTGWGVAAICCVSVRRRSISSLASSSSVFAVVSSRSYTRDGSR